MLQSNAYTLRIEMCINTDRLQDRFHWPLNSILVMQFATKSLTLATIVQKLA